MLNASLVFGMNPWLLGGLITLGVIIIAIVVLYFVGRKLQKKQEAATAEMNASAQWTTALIIDKKHMKLAEAGFPQIVVDQTPKYARRTKVAVVKARIGAKTHSLMCDEKVFDLVPIKKECKLKIAGIYIMEAKGIRGQLVKDEKPKKGLFSRFKKNKQ